MPFAEKMFEKFNREKIRHEISLDFAFTILRHDWNAVNFIGQRS